MRKVAATFDFEKSLWKQNKRYVVGIDEVGRGAWAGPLVAAAVIFPKDFDSKTGLFDSKLLSVLQREKLNEFVWENSLVVGIGQTEVSEIIKLGLTLATQLAYQRALVKIESKIDHYFIDAFYLKDLPKENQTPIVRGDQLCASIAAASIVAKVYRDRLMQSLGQFYEKYNLAANKGYGTKAHQEAIANFGLTALHRSNYNLRFLNVKD